MAWLDLKGFDIVWNKRLLFEPSITATVVGLALCVIAISAWYTRAAAPNCLSLVFAFVFVIAAYSWGFVVNTLIRFFTHISVYRRLSIEYLRSASTRLSSSQVGGSF